MHGDQADDSSRKRGEMLANIAMTTPMANDVERTRDKSKMRYITHILIQGKKLIMHDPIKVWNYQLTYRRIIF